MDPYSWRAYDAEAARQRADSQAQIQQAEAAQVANARAGRAQRQMIDEILVRPFLSAMAAARNPGAVRGRHWYGGPRTEAERNTTHAYGGPQFFFTVSTRRGWMFGQTAAIVGMRVKEGVDAWRYSQSFDSGEITVLTTAQIKTFQDALVALLRQHHVPLPQDPQAPPPQSPPGRSRRQARNPRR